MQKRRNWLIGLNIFLVLFIMFAVIFFIRSNRPMKQAKTEAVALAKKHTDLQEVDDFYWYTRDETYFSLLGRDKDEKKIAVIIPEKGDKIKVYEQKDGLTKNEAIVAVQKKHEPDKVTKVNLGIYQDQPVWEVVGENEKGHLSYYLVNFLDGKIVNLLENL